MMTGRKAQKLGTGRAAQGIIVLLLVALGAAGALSGCDLVDRHVAEKYEAATKRWNDGDYRNAVQLYIALVKEHPRSQYADNALYWIGMTQFLYLGETDKSLQSLRLLLKKYPRRDMAPAAQLAIAEIYELGYNDYPRAIEEYAKAAEYTDKEIRERSLFSIGENLLRLKKGDEASDTWKRQVQEFPAGKRADAANFRLGTLAFAKGEIDEAEGFYRRTIEISADADLTMKAKFSLAECHEAKEHLTEALALFRELEPQYPNKDVIQIKINALETRIQKKSY